MTAPEPLLVVYPHSGKHALLHWYTDHDRAHVVVAKSERAVLDAARVIANVEPFAELKSLSWVEIVAPPEKLARLAAEQKRADAVRMFGQEISQRMQAAIALGLALPPPLSICFRYSPGDEGPRPDEWMRERHSGCQNCIDRIVLGMEPAAFFDAYASAWNASQPSAWRWERRDPNQPGITSRGRIASADEALWCAWSNFGNHAPGIELRMVNTDDGEPGYPGYFDRVLFYFKRLEELDSGEKITRMFSMSRRDFEAKREAEKEERKKKRVAEEALEFENALAFFRERAK
jgi:hypothetical protein